MPPPRALLTRSSLTKPIQLRSLPRRQHVQTTIRACSCSSRPQHPPHQTKSMNFSSSQALQKETQQLNPTTSDPPTPQTDHRTLAHTHNLFITSPYSPGSPLLLPNGTYIFQKLQSFLRAQYPLFGFQEVVTPNIYKKSLWETSGHWENYADDMFSVTGRGATGTTEGEVGEDEEFGLKPMNCPGHCILFRDGGEGIRSWRDLPVRYADFSALHRNEISGSLTGLTRVRRFHQDDAHIFCRPDQILEEIEQTLRFVGLVYDTFNLGPYKLLLSTRPEDHYIGTLEEWNRAESQLTTALDNSGREWAVNQGDGAFYGPKIDIILKGNQGKEHQTATIQLDFQLPQRFDLQYQGNPHEELALITASLEETSRPVIIHRAIYGSLERFMALLIEHYNNTYPFWLSPRPAIILPLNQDPALLAYTNHLKDVLSGIKPATQDSGKEEGKLRPLPLNTTHLPIETDTSARSLGKKIAEARSGKYNHIIVVGNSELESQTLKLEVVNQPRVADAEGVLEEVLGRKLEAGDRKKGRGKEAGGKEKGSVAVSLSAKEARGYFEGLVGGYL